MTNYIVSLRSSARRPIARTALLTLSVFFSHALFAQPAQTMATADVPFAFSTGVKVLPAGHYTFVRLDQNDYVLKQADGSSAQIIHVLPGDRPKGVANSVLRFHQYGHSYFLEGAWFAGSETGIHMMKGKAEREMEASIKLPENSGITLALNTAAPRK